jgi:poly(A) polymerase
METNSNLQFFECGGCIRDEFLGIPSKDVDFSVVGATSFDAMVAELDAMGFIILTTKAETLTAVCKVPTSMPELLERTKVADFVMARKESSASDGRMPDVIEPGTLLDDLSRRDFTVNAMARDPKTRELIDPFGGIVDLDNMILNFVGDPMLRIKEDPLRVARAFRFIVTKGFSPSHATWDAITSPEAARLIATKRESTTGKLAVSTERLQVEMDKMDSTLRSLRFMAEAPEWTRSALFPVGLRLSATMKER